MQRRWKPSRPGFLREPPDSVRCRFLPWTYRKPRFHFGRLKATGTAPMVVFSPGLQRCPFSSFLLGIAAQPPCRANLTLQLSNSASQAQPGPRRAPARAPDAGPPPPWNAEVRWQLQPQSRASSERRGPEGRGDSRARDWTWSPAGAEEKQTRGKR